MKNIIIDLKSNPNPNIFVLGSPGRGISFSVNYAENTIPHIQKCMKENKHPKTESETTKAVLDYMFYKQLISEEEKKRYIKEWCEANTSFVVTDPKGTLLRETGHFFEKMGYRVEVLDLNKK